MAQNGIDSIQISNFVKVLASNLAGPVTEVEEIQSVGELTDEATIVDVPAYGSSYMKKLVGSKSAGPMEIVCSLVPDSTVAPVQQSLRDAYTDGTEMFFTVQMLNATSDAGDEVSFKGFVTSATVSNDFDAVRTQTFSIAVNGALSAMTAMDFA